VRHSAFTLATLVGWAASAQPTYFNRAYDYGLDQWAEIFGAVVSVTDGYLVAGQRIYLSTRESILAKLSSSGDSVWLWIEGDDTMNHTFHWLTKVSDEEFLCGEATRDRTNGQYDYLIVKLNGNGDTIWWRQFGDSVYWEGTRGAVVDHDGNYVVLAYMNTLGDPLWGQTVLMKMDTDGNQIWFQEYGTVGKHDHPWSLVQTRDSGFLITGSRYGPYLGDDRDLMLIKTDRDGNHQWTKYYGGPHDGFGAAICKSLEGGYMVAGYREVYEGTQQTFKGWLLKIDEDGNMEWDNFYQHEEWIDNGFWRNIMQLGDSSYVVLGWVEAPKDQGVIVKVDRNGEKTWSRAYTRNASFNHYFYGMDTTSDGGFIVCGSTLISSQTTQDGWLLKLDEWGCDTPGCHIEDTTGTALPPGPPAGGESITVWPNPNNGTFTVQLPGDGEWQVQLFDLNGRLVEERRQERTAQWDVSGLAKGLYLLKAVARDGTSASTKVLIE